MALYSTNIYSHTVYHKVTLPLGIDPEGISLNIQFLNKGQSYKNGSLPKLSEKLNAFFTHEYRNKVSMFSLRGYKPYLTPGQSARVSLGKLFRWNTFAGGFISYSRLPLKKTCKWAQLYFTYLWYFILQN